MPVLTTSFRIDADIIDFFREWSKETKVPIRYMIDTKLLSVIKKCPDAIKKKICERNGDMENFLKENQLL